MEIFGVFAVLAFVVISCQDCVSPCLIQPCVCRSCRTPTLPCWIVSPDTGQSHTSSSAVLSIDFLCVKLLSAMCAHSRFCSKIRVTSALSSLRHPCGDTLNSAESCFPPTGCTEFFATECTVSCVDGPSCASECVSALYRTRFLFPELLREFLRTICAYYGLDNTSGFGGATRRAVSSSSSTNFAGCGIKGVPAMTTGAFHA